MRPSPRQRSGPTEPSTHPPLPHEAGIGPTTRNPGRDRASLEDSDQCQSALCWSSGVRRPVVGHRSALPPPGSLARVVCRGPGGRAPGGARLGRSRGRTGLRARGDRRGLPQDHDRRSVAAHMTLGHAHPPIASGRPLEAIAGLKPSHRFDYRSVADLLRMMDPHQAHCYQEVGGVMESWNDRNVGASGWGS